MTKGQDVLAVSAFLVSAGAMIVCERMCVEMFKGVGGSKLVQYSDRHNRWMEMWLISSV